VLVNFIPTYIQWYHYGRNHDTPDREPEHVLNFSLRPAELFLPERYHRIDYVRKEMEKYHFYIKSHIENQSPYVGGVGVIGLTVLLAWAVGVRWNDPRRQLLATASQYTVLGIVVACVGGIGLLIALYTHTMIRSYHRMSVFIAFFALVAVAILLERIRPRQSRVALVAWYGLLAAVAVLGIAEQTSPTFVPLYAEEKKDFAADHELVAAIERQLPDNAMILEVPHNDYPESIRGYELMRPYFHSQHLRWSYGYIRGGRDEQWMREHQLLSDDINVLLPAAQREGYAGIWVDLLEPQGLWFQMQLERMLDQPPLLSTNGRAAFFFLTQGNHPPASSQSQP
jgi:phosphoglycerol transferase